MPCYHDTRKRKKCKSIKMAKLNSFFWKIQQKPTSQSSKIESKFKFRSKSLPLYPSTSIQQSQSKLNDCNTTTQHDSVEIGIDRYKRPVVGLVMDEKSNQFIENRLENRIDEARIENWKKLIKNENRVEEINRKMKRLIKVRNTLEESTSKFLLYSSILFVTLFFGIIFCIFLLPEAFAELLFDFRNFVFKMSGGCTFSKPVIPITTTDKIIAFYKILVKNCINLMWSIFHPNSMR